MHAYFCSIRFSLNMQQRNVRRVNVRQLHRLRMPVAYPDEVSLELWSAAFSAMDNFPRMLTRPKVSRTRPVSHGQGPRHARPRPQTQGQGQVLGNSNVGIQCTFTIIQYCIIYMIWRLALLFIPRPEHSRPRPNAQGQGLRIPRPRNLALRPRINIPAIFT